MEKIIHYCWFGREPLNEMALKCIESWKHFFPDYKIIQWNEDNFDITQISFMENAYRDKKWAFVSDVARLIVVYNYGGIYFDTDVEVIKSYKDILDLELSGFCGFEKDGCVNTGLGFGAQKGHPFLKKLIELYKDIDYESYREHISDIACPILTTRLLQDKGLIQNDKYQLVEQFNIYPSEYFAPMDYNTGKMRYSNNTHSIHWYSSSWLDDYTKKEQEYLRRFSRVFGVKIGEILYGISSCFRKEGMTNYFLKRIKKYLLRRN